MLNLIPARYRKAIYDLITLAAIAFGAWQASEGNWETFVGSLLTAITTRMASANTTEQ